jgi:DNA replication protein DnaC
MNSTSTYTRILDNLKFLKSTESINVIDKTMEYVNKNNLNFIDGFLYFTEAQVEQKKENLIRHSVCMAGFPKIKSLAEFEFDYQPSINKEQIYDLNSLRFIEKQENVVFYGNSGVGKTHLATAIGVTAAQNRNSTYFIKCADLMETLHKAQLEGRLQERLKKFTGYKLLIIDELGYLPITRDDSKLFFQLIDRIYERNSTIVTTNINFSQWDDIFGDPLIAGAIVDRLLHHATVVTIKGKSYRLQNFYRAEEESL